MAMQYSEVQPVQETEFVISFYTENDQFVYSTTLNTHDLQEVFDYAKDEIEDPFGRTANFIGVSAPTKALIECHLTVTMSIGMVERNN